MEQHMTDDIAEEIGLLTSVIKQVLTSPNVSDSNFERANLVDTTNFIAENMYEVSKANNRIADALFALNDTLSYFDAGKVDK